MRFIVLSSGSKGNTTYIEYKDTKILIDIGNTCKYVCDKLKEIGVNAEEIDAILITHTHSDHIKGLKTFIKKFHTKVYLSSVMLEELDYINNYELIQYDGFQINDFLIQVLKTSHDASDPVGYVVWGGDKRIVYITDTGYINEKYFSMLMNAEAYILESNHDIEMLNHSKYSFQLRKRIMGDKGHLSNYDCSRYLGRWLGNHTNCVVLAHLSEENNTPELAFNTFLDKMNELEYRPDKIIVALQDQVTEMVEI